MQKAVCETCKRVAETVVEFSCTSSTNVGIDSLAAFSFRHPAVIGFYYDHGHFLGYDFDDTASLTLEFSNSDVAVLSIDPPSARVTFSEGKKSFSCRTMRTQLSSLSNGGSIRLKQSNTPSRNALAEDVTQVADACGTDRVNEMISPSRVRIDCSNCSWNQSVKLRLVSQRG